MAGEAPKALGELSEAERAHIDLCLRACEGVSPAVLRELSVQRLLRGVDQAMKICSGAYPNIRLMRSDYNVVTRLYAAITEPVGRLLAKGVRLVKVDPAHPVSHVPTED